MPRSTLTASSLMLAGLITTLFGGSPTTGTPLLVIAGLVGVALGGAFFVLPARHRPRPRSRRAVGVADPCQFGNHAGCLDSPDCFCGCHRERVELRLPAL